jgi:hypothetical protein
MIKHFVLRCYCGLEATGIGLVVDSESRKESGEDLS